MMTPDTARAEFDEVRKYLTSYPARSTVRISPQQLIALLRCTQEDHPICLNGYIFGRHFVVDESDPTASVLLANAFPNRAWVLDSAFTSTRS